MEGEFNVRDALAFARRQAGLVLSVVACILVLTTLALYALPPKYTATTKILVDASSKNLLNPSEQAVNQTSDSARVDSEVEILNSDDAKIEVIRQKDLIGDEEFGALSGLLDRLLIRLNLKKPVLTGDQALALTIDRLSKAVNVEREGMTNIISLSVVSKNPRRAAELATALADAYISQQVSSKISATLAARNIIQRRVGEANDAIVDSEKKFDQYLTENLDRIEKDTGSAAISRLRAELGRVKQQEIENAGRLKLAESSLDRGDLSSVVSALQSKAVTDLEKQRSTASEKLASATGTGANVTDLTAELQALDHALKEKAAIEIGSLKQKIETDRQSTDKVRQQLRDTILASDLPAELLTGIYSLQQKSQIARTQYQSLLARLQDLDAQADMQIADSRIVSAALAPAMPSFPKKKLVLSLALAVSLMAGCGLAILRENFVGGITGEQQAERLFHAPLAAVVPERSEKSAGVERSLADLVLKAPFSMFAESVRRITARIDQLHRDRAGVLKQAEAGGIVVLLSSSVPREGKSTLSLSVARSLSGAGKRVLLIDGDLRKPSLHLLMDIEPSAKLLEFLYGHQKGGAFAHMFATDPLSGIMVIAGQPGIDYPTDHLFDGPRFEQLLTAARKHFDYIVLDSPPVDAVVDTLHIARHADIVGFVVRWASTSQSLARKSLSALSAHARHGAPIFVILNKKEQGKVASFYQSSGYYS